MNAFPQLEVAAPNFFQEIVDGAVRLGDRSD